MWKRKEIKFLSLLICVVLVLLSIILLRANKFSYGQLWSAPSTVKIMDTETAYEQKGDAELSYQAVKNEYESCQLILTATENVEAFHLYASDLKCGKNILSADNVEIYVQKYTTYDDTAYRNLYNEDPYIILPETSYREGNIPDALIPMEAANAYGENAIAAGHNGGLWVTIYVPKDTVAGVYEGKFKLEVDGAKGTEVLQVPVSIEVFDYILSDNITAQTLFSWRYDRVAVGELDGSLEMMKNYYEFFQDYRISLQSLPVGTLSGEEFVEHVEAYYDQLTTYNILSSVGDTFSGMSKVAIQEKVKEQILAVAAASTPNKNLLDKAMFYFIDEPDFTNARARAGVISQIQQLHTVLQGCVDSIKADTSGLYAEFQQIDNWEDSILNIPNMIPTPHAAWLIENESTEEAQALLNVLNCICPTYHTFNGRVDEFTALCAKYDIALWWYGCTIPPASYPTYHIGDTNLLSARSVSWIQSIYDIEGNLYWDAAAYTEAASENYNEYINMYENPYRKTGATRPAGDGFLTYPGAAYGIYGPLPSMRLMSIRDGMEEYELLEYMKELGKEETLQSFCSSICNGGTQMYADGEMGLDFTALRKELLNHISGTQTGEISVADEVFGTSNQAKGKVIIAPKDKGNIGNQAMTVNEEEGTERLLSFDSYANITGTSIRMSKLMGATRVNMNAEHITEGNASWKIIPEGDYGDDSSYPWFRMRCTSDSFASSNFDKYECILMDVYNDSDEEVSIRWSFTVYGMTGDYAVAEEVICNLKPNAWTTCKYDLTNDVDGKYCNFRDVEYMTVTFLDKKVSKDDVNSPLYFDNLRGELAGRK